MSKTTYMRGLQNFIQDIRAAQNKDQEQRRVEKELAKIRERFSDDRSLKGYDRRKYVWKLLYIYMLGYDVQFGHKQAADLIPQAKYKDKQVGYMACALLLRENDEFLRLTMNAVRQDLMSRNEAFETLALSFIGNVGGVEMADALTQDVVKLLSSGTARPLVKKRASLALLRLIRKSPPENQVVHADTFSPVINSLLEERDLGLLLSATTLLQGVCARNGPSGYEGSQSRLIKVLERLTVQREREVPHEYLYYGIPSPWLQCKCLRVLQFFPPPEAAQELATINALFQGILDSVGIGDAAKQGNANKAHALYGILFEAISLCFSYDTDRNLLGTCVTVLGNLLSAKEPNVKYLALETLSRLALVPEILETIRHHQATVVTSLRDPDVSIRKRAMDLLFTMCDSTCAEELVKEMLEFLVVADLEIREELVLKVAILAEKFAPNVQWYVDVALVLLEKAGDYVSEEVWHRVVQLVTNNPAMQQYAALNVAQVLKRGACHEALVCTAAYILGEFGRLIATDHVTPREQFQLLNNCFATASQTTKGLLMTAFIKLYLLDPQNAAFRTEVLGLFEKHQRYMDVELQQRAVEYLRLAASPQAAQQHYLLPMPKWEERESSLLKRLQQTEGQDADSAPAAYAAASANVANNMQQTTGAVSGTGSTAVTPTTQLVVGPPVIETTPSASQPAAVVDLLGSTGNTPKANGTATPAVPAKPADAVDLLSDLLGDVLVAPPAAAAGAAGAPPAFTGQMPVATGPPPFAGATGVVSQPPVAGAMGAQPPFAGATGAMAAPPFAGPTGYTQGPYAGYTGAPAAMGPYAGYTGAPAATGPYATYTGAPPATGPYAGYTGAPTSAVAGPYAGFTGAPGPAAGPYAGYTGAAPLLQQGPHAGYTGAPAAPAAGPYAGYTGAPASQAGPYAGFTGAGYVPGAVTMPPPVAGPTGAAGAPPPLAGPTGAAAPPPLAGPTGQVSSFATASAAAFAAAGSEAIKPIGSVEQWLTNLLVKDRGILYEDPHLQVGLQARYARGTGQVVLFLGNKSRDAVLSNLKLLPGAPPPGGGLQLTVAPSPPTLAPGQQVQVAIQAAAVAPFSGTPALTLEYQLLGGTLSGQGVRQELRLPIAPHKFVIPEPAIPAQVFFEQWKALSAPPSRAQELVDRGTPIPSPSVVAAMRLTNLGVEHAYLDPNAHNEAGAGYFICGPPGGPEQSILIMARVEGNPATMAQFRVTVASSAPALAAYMKDMVITQIKTAAA